MTNLNAVNSLALSFSSFIHEQISAPPNMVHNKNRIIKTQA